MNSLIRTPSTMPRAWAASAACFVAIAGCSSSSNADKDPCTDSATCAADASAGDGGTDRGADAREPDAASQPTDAGTSATSDSEYAVDVTSQLAAPCDFTIRNNGDWGEVNNALYRVICVEPGDYTGAGTVTIGVDGSAARPRVLRLASSVDPALHPINATRAQQAWAPRLRLDNANYWIIDRLSLNHGDSGVQIAIRNGSSDNVINRLNMYGGINAIEQFIDFQGVCRCHRNVIQNSVFGGVKFTSDSVCVALNGFGVYAEMHDNRIVQNEFINCNDAVQTVTRGGQSTPSGNFAGTIIDQNDMYVTSDYHVDCDTGALDPAGWCACAENAIDLKGGSDDPANPLIISNNRMYGFRDTKEGGVCGTASGAWGTAAGSHFGVTNVVFTDNVVYDSNRGYGDVRGTLGPLSFERNVFHSIHDRAAASNGGHALLLGGLGGISATSASFLVRDNIFVDTVYFAGFSISNLEFFGNDLVNAGVPFRDPAPGQDSHDNRWWGTARPASFAGSGDVIEGDIERSGLATLCVAARRWTDPSFEICLHHARRP